MGFFSKSGRFFVSTMAGVAMLHTNRALFGQIRSNVSLLRRGRCPVCKAGRLFEMREEVDGKVVLGVGCSQCSHVQNIRTPEDEEWGHSASTLLLDKQRNQAIHAFERMGSKEKESLMKRMRVFSRVGFSGASLMLVVSAWGAWEGSLWTFTNGFVLSVWLMARGMKQSYRHWQIVNKRLFEPGLVREWLSSGQWLI